ncbi:MAG: 3-deoxy-7-phosphoheptulonate synthase [Acidobacteria bacterium]|nr:3-deoxy-7-phosphoheptulonate synthase [Acidobacteriota bacterium]
MNDNVRRVTIRDCSIGGPDLTVMGGPCAIESREQIFAIAEVVAASGGRFLRGGAFKVRTAPTTFQGLGWDGWRLLREAADAHGLLTVSEILEDAQIEQARRYIDLAQIGSRNMQNTSLLKALGRSGMPVMLKRGFGCTIDEWLHAAEYILQEGNEDVLLCERGIRTFETATRFTLDVAAIPIARARLGVPVIVDPSHAAGQRDWVECLTLSGVAAGGDGLLIETHPNPSEALSDGPQAVVLSEFPALMARARHVAAAVGRSIPVALAMSAAVG